MPNLKTFLSWSWLALAIHCVLPQALAQEIPTAGKKIVDIHPSDVIIWDAAQAVRQADGSVLVGLRLSTRENFSIYKSRLTFEGPSGYTPSLSIEAPARLQNDPMGEGQIEVYDGGDFELLFRGSEAYAASSIKFRITFLGCTERICLFPFTKEFDLPVYGAPAAAATKQLVPPQGEESQPAQRPSGTGLDDLTQADDHNVAPTPAGKAALSVEEQYAKKLESGKLPWALVLIVVFLGGIMTNLTPCVFPMIPITIRLLGKQGHRPLAAALVYASGIVATYTGLGLLASLSGGVFGSLLALPGVNIAFAVIFIVLGFTMLGFGNLSKLQSIGAQFGSGHASFLNAFGMGAGAGLVAAPCTGPIMGALLAYSTQLRAPSQAAILFFLYSLGFALPYIFLGLVANRVAAYKVSARIQVAVKMLFAAAMFALALYYFKNIAHEALLPLQGYWRIASLSLLGLAFVLLVVVVRHPHLIHVKSSHLLPAFLLALGLFSAIQWATGADIKSRLHFLKDENAAFEAAKASGKPILVDGWADWCVACKKMDQTTFASPAVISLLQDGWVLVKLDLTESNDATEALAEKYGMQGLPTLVMIPSDGDLSRSRRLTGYVNDERLLEELHGFLGR